MATSRERQTTDLPFFDTRMNFSGPVLGRARIDVPNWSDTNMALQPHDLRIHDARPIIDALSLDREGFALVRHECGITDAFDINADGPGYHAAVAGLLGELTGASLVLPQGKGLIKRSGAWRAPKPKLGPHAGCTWITPPPRLARGSRGSRAGRACRSGITRGSLSFRRGDA